MSKKIAYHIFMDANSLKKILGSSLRELRIDKGLTQEKLAELIGVQVNTVNRIETGTSFVTSETFARICNVFNIHPSVLMTSKPKHILKEHLEYIKAINQLLQTFSLEKLKNAYDILSVMNK